MILFVADDHFGMHPGRRLYEQLPPAPELIFAENDLSVLTRYPLDPRRDLLILNLIGGTGSLPPADDEVLARVKTYCDNGGNLLLLHGASAAFWHCAWWRQLVGLRWVRPGDPDGVEPSWHPIAPYRLEVAKTRHPLHARLRPLTLPEDEIYLGLEQTAPFQTLLTTDYDGKTHPQCVETVSPSGGKIVSLLPGHRPEVVTAPGLVALVRLLILYLQPRNEDLS